MEFFKLQISEFEKFQEDFVDLKKLICDALLYLGNEEDS